LARVSTQGSRPPGNSTEALLAAAGLSALGTDASATAREAALRALGGMAEGLDPVQLALLREAAIKALRGTGAEGPARLVDAVLPRPSTGSERGEGAGTAVLFPEVTPWAEPLRGEALLTEIEAAIRKHVVVPGDAASAMALWILHTHAIDAAEISPRLAIVSPTKRCGKSTVLKILGALVRRPLASTNVTAAGIYRGIEAHQPTLLVDEADTFLDGRDDLRGVLNAGHDRRSATVLRCTGDELEPRLFRVFCPVAIAAIGRLPDTLMDRSIVIEMRRKTRVESVERLRRAEREALTAIPRRCARWVADNLEELRSARPAIPADLDDRAADNWEPLLSIADTAGGPWPNRARATAIRLSDARAAADDGEDFAVQLLADVRLVFDQRREERLTSKAVVSALGDLEGRPWADVSRGRPITDRLLARLLGRFGVRSRSIRVGDATPKGYLRGDLADAFDRYLAPLAATSATPSKSLGVVVNLQPPRAPGVALDRNGRLACDCVGVADVALDETYWPAEAGDESEER
jgi:putative DNA primase/helicase